MSIAIYMRVSSDVQQERGTIEGQREYAEKYVDLHGLKDVKYYAEDGFTGVKPLAERPVGSQLVADAQAGNVSEVLVYKVDRFGRDTRSILNAVYDLEQTGIAVKSMSEPFDTSTPSGRFMLNMMASVAMLDHDTILERFSAGINRAAREDNRWLGGICPLGYTVVDKHLQVLEDEADLVRKMFDFIGNQGWTTVKVANYLNSLNIPTAYNRGHGKRKTGTSGIWQPGRISNIMKNTTYKGVHTFGKRTDREREKIERLMPAIIEEDLWARAQKQLGMNQIDAAKARGNNKYLLRGLLKCGACGRNYSGSQKRGANAYYNCNGKISYNGQKLQHCPNPNIRTDKLEKAVWDEISEMLTNPESVKHMFDFESQQKKIKEFMIEKNKLLDKLKEKKKEHSRLIDMIVRGIVAGDIGEPKLKALGEEQKTLTKRIEDLEEYFAAAEMAAKEYRQIYETIKNANEWYDQSNPNDRQAIVRHFIDRIEITESSGKAKATIFYKFIPPDAPCTDRSAWKYSTYHLFDHGRWPLIPTNGETAPFVV